MDGSSANASHRRRAEKINHVWSFDFCHDRTADGRALKVFSVLDEYTRRCLTIETQRRITGIEVTRILESLMALYGVPEHVRCDNGYGNCLIIAGYADQCSCQLIDDLLRRLHDSFGHGRLRRDS